MLPALGVWPSAQGQLVCLLLGNYPCTSVSQTLTELSALVMACPQQVRCGYDGLTEAPLGLDRHPRTQEQLFPFPRVNTDEVMRAWKGTPREK